LVARKVAARLKPDSLTEFTNLMEREILPWLQRQEGFLDLIILAVPPCREVATISFWDDKVNAQSYHAEGYPEALNVLQNLLDGIPYVKTYEVVGRIGVRIPGGQPQSVPCQIEPRPESGFYF
jgi:hypothetical protein